MLPSPLVLFTEPLGLLIRDGRPAWGPAEDALAELARRKVPLIFSSRGTRLKEQATSLTAMVNTLGGRFVERTRSTVAPAKKAKTRTSSM